MISKSSSIILTHKNNGNATVEHVKLSHVDNIVMSLRSTRIYAFNSEYRHLPSESLKESLQETLYHYPILSGRFDEHKDQNNTTDWYVCLNNSGVLYTEAYCPVILPWKDGDYDGRTILEMFSYNDLVEWAPIENTSTSPLLSIQVTRFLCGSIIISVIAHHGIADGDSTTTFIRSWADIHRNKAVSFRPVSFHALDRQAYINTFIREHSNSSISNNTTVCVITKDVSSNVNSLVSSTFHLSKHSIETLKSKFLQQISQNGTLKYFTTNDVVCAFIVLCVQKYCIKAKDVTLRMPVNLRRFFNNIPRYFGNLFVRCQLTFINHQENDDFALFDRVDVPEQIHEVTHSMTKEDAANKLTTMSIPKPDHKTIVISNWCSFDMYATDFGFGNVAYIGFPTAEFRGNGVYATILPAPNSDGVNIYIYMEKLQLDELKNSTEWMAYVK